MLEVCATTPCNKQLHHACQAEYEHAKGIELPLTKICFDCFPTSSPQDSSESPAAAVVVVAAQPPASVADPPPSPSIYIDDDLPDSFTCDYCYVIYETLEEAALCKT